MKLFKIILISFSIIIFVFITVILSPYFIIKYFNNKRNIGNEIIVETQHLNYEDKFIIRNFDNLYGKYHLIISLAPNNIDELRMEHNPIEFSFKIEIKQNNDIIVKTYNYKLEEAIIGFSPFVIFEMPKDVKHKIGEDIHITIKEIIIDKNYYKTIKFLIYKSNFKYRTD
jgi:hypothetical protein